MSLEQSNSRAQLTLDENKKNLNFDKWKISDFILTENVPKTIALEAKVCTPVPRLAKFFTKEVASWNAAARFGGIFMYPELIGSDDNRRISACVTTVEDLLTGDPTWSHTETLQPDGSETEAILHNVPLCPSFCRVMTGENMLDPFEDEYEVLLSSGMGDLSLTIINCRSTGSTLQDIHTTRLIYPLSLRPPMIGYRSFRLLCGYRDGEDSIIACIWAVAEDEDASGHVSPRLCTTYVVRLHLEGKDNQHSLSIVDICELLSTSEPPVRAMCNPVANSILLVVEHGYASIENNSDHSQEFQTEESKDVSSPRTFEMAQQMLKQYTSDTLNKPRHGPVDFFGDVGVEDADLSEEPACSLFIFSQHCGANQPSWRQTTEYFCGKHRYLDCQENNGELYIILKDDIDAAIVSIKPISLESSSDLGYSITHEKTLPALSYIAAAKANRKYLLAAPSFGVFLVESNQYCFAYANVSETEEIGKQQIIQFPGNSNRERTAFIGAVTISSNTLVLLTEDEVYLIN